MEKFFGIANLAIVTMTLAIVVAQEVRYRRRGYPAMLEVIAGMSITDAHLGKPAHIIELANHGREPILIRQIKTFDSTPYMTVDYRITSWVLHPGAPLTFLLFAKDIDKAWLAVEWSRIEERGRGQLEWMPLRGSTPLDDEFSSSVERSVPPKWRWWPRKGPALHRVGPGHYFRRPQPKTLRQQQKKTDQLVELLTLEETKMQGRLMLGRVEVDSKYIAACPDLLWRTDGTTPVRSTDPGQPEGPDM